MPVHAGEGGWRGVVPLKGCRTGREAQGSQQAHLGAPSWHQHGRGQRGRPSPGTAALSRCLHLATLQPGRPSRIKRPHPVQAQQMTFRTWLLWGLLEKCCNKTTLSQAELDVSAGRPARPAVSLHPWPTESTLHLACSRGCMARPPRCRLRCCLNAFDPRAQRCQPCWDRWSPRCLASTDQARRSGSR